MRHRGIVVIAAAFGVAVLLGGCGMSKSASANLNQPAASTSVGAAQAISAVQPATSTPMGQVGVSGTWSVVIKDVARGPQSGGVKAAKGDELIVIHCWLKNLGVDDEKLDASSFTLNDRGGLTYPVSPASGPGFLFNVEQPIRPHTTYGILLAYEVRKGAGPFTWTFTPPGQDTQIKAAVLQVN
jgi:hypothetical protein